MCRHIIRYACHGIAATVLASMFFASIAAQAADEPPAIGGPKGTWHDGSARYDFVMDEQTLAIKPSAIATDDKAGTDVHVRCILVVPKKAAFEIGRASCRERV